MAVLEFNTDPGPPPYVTIRDVKWANRLADLPMAIRMFVKSSGKRGMVIVAGVAPIRNEDWPVELRGIYSSEQKVIAVRCEAPPACDGAHQPDLEWGMCARCGAPN